MKRRLLLFVTLLLVLVLVFWWLLRTPALPEGLGDGGDKYTVTIERDTWGVPHIYGRTDADVAYGLALAHAADDFDTIQGALLAARGKLASVYGADMAPNDYMVHLLRVWEVVENGYPALPESVRALCEAYAEGINRHAALHPEAALPHLYPLRGADVVAGFVHKVPLFFGLDTALRDLFAETRQHRVSAYTPSATPMGSNAFAVAPSRTADGSTLLAINSHQPWTGPVAWYEAHLHSEAGWDMIGGTFPGAPLILHGHNAHLGWAHTVNKPDLLDVFVLETHPDDPYQYRYDGVWHTLEVRTAPITVKLWGPFSWTFEREVLWSVYGPAVQQPHGTYALRFAGYGDVRQVEQWYRMNKATTFDDWQAAMALQAIPSFNTVYADQSGTIYYLYNARLPRRDASYNWQQYLPGDTAATCWETYIPFDALPQVLNPPSGFVQNANSSPFYTTTGPGNPDPDHFSPTLGIETHLTNRARRALHLLGSDEAITWEAFKAYKYDMAYAADSRMAALITTIDSLPPDTDPLLPGIQDHLRQWDLGTQPRNTHAALAVMAFQPFLTSYGPIPPADTLLTHLHDAAQTLQTTFGRLDVPWESVHRLRRGATDLGLGGGPDVLHAIHSTLSDDHRLVGHAGDSYVLMVRWDNDGKVHSESIHQFGSATRDTASPHYDDQAPHFVQRTLKQAWPH